MAWIRIIPYESARGRLKKIYDRIKAPSGQIDNILLAHSLRPHTLEGHLSLYKHVLHNAANQLPVWFLEAIGVQVSALNNCEYCVEHHKAGLRRALADDQHWREIISALKSGATEGTFSPKEAALLRYAAALTVTPSDLSSEIIDGLREDGADDGEILEVNQVTAYFAYANRTVLGLGVTTTGEELGLSPNRTDNENDWQHH
ncbi:MAG TPA: alkylhydroperoxidase [Sneathiellales bacterium]|jgi:uncharacterized peroxidase-related enzyme|nr:alkylhydroperoxidase [Sneathiellales bacterium]